MDRLLLGVLIVFNLVGAGYLVNDRMAADDRAAASAPTATSAPLPTTSADPTTTTSTSTTTQPPPTTAPEASPAARRAAVFRGLGAWIDVYDFSPAYMQEGEERPVVKPADVDFLADVGVRTIYIQAARDDERTPGDVESPALVGRFIERAHARGMRVVAWYLPKRYDGDDLRRLQALRDFRAPDGTGFDGIGLDIEFRGDVADVSERNARLVELSKRLRETMGDYPLAAIVLPPVLTDIVNPDYWPSFPWQEIAPHFDVWMPMSYWTDRKSSSEWSDPFRYIHANVEMLREHLRDPEALVHPVGGIGDAASLEDYRAFVEAAHHTGSIGASVYDYRTTPTDAWQILIGAPG